MENKKFFDIIPPIKYQKGILAKKEMLQKKRAPLARFSVKKSFLSTFLILFLGGIFIHFFFQKAEITVWPETEVVSFQTDVNISSEVNLSDLSRKSIPGKILASEKLIFQEFSSSGQFLKEVRAKGVIRIYNTYSTLPQVLIAKTRFVSAEGRLFRTPIKIIIPGGKYEKGKLQSGFLDVEVVAAGAGEEYNIGPSTFSIPGFAGTERFTAFYGKSFESMKEGFKNEVSQVTQEDLNAALKKLEEKIEKEAEIAFKNKISEELILIDEAFRKEVDSPIFSSKAGEEGDSFIGEMRVSFKALVFQQQDLKELVKKIIISEIPKDKMLKIDSLEITYMASTIDLERGRMNLDLDFSAKIYSHIDTNLLKREIFGKLLKESKIILDEKLDIIKSEVKLSPFWLNRIPKNIQKIEIELRIDSSTGSL